MSEAQREAPEGAADRWEVYGRVALRAMLAAVAGGTTIGLVTAAIIVPELTLWGGFVGTVYGVLCGVTAGPIVASTLAIFAVPYRGQVWTRSVAAFAATASVAVFLVVAPGDPTDFDSLGVGISSASIIGAAVCSPYLVSWYITRSEHHASEAGNPTRSESSGSGWVSDSSRANATWTTRAEPDA